MSDRYILIFYVYREGSASDLADEHKVNFETHDTIDWDSPFVETVFGRVRISPNDVPAITNMSHLENYRYESEDSELDLLYAPLVKYYLDDEQYFEGGKDHPFGAAEKEPTAQFAEMVATGYMATEKRPVAVCAITPEHRAAIDVGRTPFSAESLARNEYEYLSWVTIFTPSMVDHYGRETVLSAPAWEVRELDDGAVLLLTHANPHEYDADRYHKVGEHLGLDTV